MADCVFCRIAAGELASHTVFEDEHVLAFLDHKPLFPGHTLLIPREHFVTLPELPLNLVEPVFKVARRLAQAVEQALDAEGTFVAMNNRVSQSVPHLHIHVVPRRKGDGLKGFFWPRKPYASEAEITDTQQRIRTALKSVH